MGIIWHLSRTVYGYLAFQDRLTMSKLGQVAVGEIRRRIYRNAYTEGRLPSEPDLALALNASRATLPQALAELEQDGLIARRHGSGTFVNQHVQGIRTRLEDVAWDFDEMILVRRVMPPASGTSL